MLGNGQRNFIGNFNALMKRRIEIFYNSMNFLISLQVSNKFWAFLSF